MLSSVRWAVALSFLAVYPASFDRTPDPISELGCPGPRGSGEVEELFLLNGEVVDRELYEAVPGSEIGLIEIVCWKKAKELFNVDVRVGVASAWTSPTPLDLIEDDFAELAEIEEVYWEIHGHYAASLVELDGFRPQKRISFEINASEDSWSGTARHDQVNYLCSIGHEYNAGSVPSHGPACHSEHVH